MRRIREALGGTRCSDAPALTPEERAQRDAERLNRERGSEDARDGYDCPKCLNRGYLYTARGAYITRRDCECRKARQSIRRMQESGLSSVIGKYTFQRYRADEEWQQHIKGLAQAYLRDENAQWFFIGGQSGGGKSHICTAICRSLLATCDVHYMLWEEESVELKSMVTDAERYQARMDKLKSVDVLYIDDFFSGKKERGGETAMPTFADVRLAREILNHRCIGGKRTILSSEWYSMEISEIDEALGGRIIEMCGLYCLNIGRDKGKNYRLRMGGSEV